MSISIFSFFSGAGFLDLGFEKEGYQVVFVNEFNQSFLETYKFSRKQMGIQEPKYGYYNGDISNLLQDDGLKVNIATERKTNLVGFIGGPPCPDFSIAGKNGGIKGDNGQLTTIYKKLILKYQPDFFILENVKGLWKTKKHRLEYEKIKRTFRDKGYSLTDKLINCLEYGVPQDRERIILLGVKSNLLHYKKSVATQILKTQFIWGNNPQYDIDFVKNFPWYTISTFAEDQNLDYNQDLLKELSVEYWFQKNDVYNHYNATDFFKPKSMDRFYQIAEGDVSRKSFKRLHRWRYSPTVAYGNNEVHLHPYKARRLSVSEALAIQSLPAEFVIPKSITKSEMFKTIGNGVPYLAARGVAHSIKLFLHLNVIEKRGENGL